MGLVFQVLTHVRISLKRNMEIVLADRQQEQESGINCSVQYKLHYTLHYTYIIYIIYISYVHHIRVLYMHSFHVHLQHTTLI